jgi:hypothetical protein
MLSLPITAAAQAQTDSSSSASDIQLQLKDLQDRLSKLESAPTATPAISRETEDRESGRIVVPAIPGVPQAFLPDIGIAGDAAFERNTLRKSDPRYSTSNQQPWIRDGQAVFFEPIDPYTLAQFTIDIPNPTQGGVANIEEAWIYFNKLPAGAAVRLGRYLPQFGLLDLTNTFQLAMLDRPNAIGNFIGSDGMNGTGMEFDAYIPNPWDWNLKLNANALEGDTLGGSAASRDLAYLATLDYSRDLFTSGSLQAGVSAAQGPSPFGQSEALEEPYLQIQYAPTQRKVWTWSAEGMLAQRRGLGANNDKSGFYTFLDYNFALRYHVGLLADWADSSGIAGGVPNQTVAPYGRQLTFGPNTSWFVSDNTRLRLQYTHTTALASLRPDDRFTFQVTFSLGNLKQLQ